VAALGEAPVDDVAFALAGLDASVGAKAHRALADAGLFAADELRFVHPAMAEATLAGLVPATRSWFHRRAATLLLEAGAPDEDVAAQLLAAEPADDPRAAGALLSAGLRALEAGDAEGALARLRRALRETQKSPARELLLALGWAEERAGRGDGAVWLRRAAA